MVIVTDHLTLRDFEERDFEPMLAYQSDPRYLRYYPDSWANRTHEEAQAFFQRFLDTRDERPRTKFQFAVTIRGSDDMIGMVGVRMDKPDSTEADIGCELAPDHWNLGYATEATHAAMSLGFDELGLHRLWAQTMAPNRGAWRVLEKLGMKREGELRETTLLADGWANSYIYGILEQEWRNRRRKSPRRDEERKEHEERNEIA